MKEERNGINELKGIKYPKDISKRKTTPLPTNPDIKQV